MSILAKVTLFVLFTCFTAQVGAAVLQNRLQEHASPYLAMHGEDPVAWQEWSPAVVERARKENKLLFVSSGYFSCHWCHVMQKESYRNEAIASLLNRFFIPVKVDRELLPALDSRLIDFVEKTQGYSGWPLNVFVTPQGYPLVGMVYVPPENFRQILESLHQQWKDAPDYLGSVAKSAARELAHPEVAKDGNLPANLYPEFESALVHGVLSEADEMQGGFGSQNKFPMAPQLDVLLSIYSANKDERLGRFLRTSLDHMATQGLNDQLGGGFYRYAVDPGWQIPHFEKMLYDNALLASVYLKAARVFQQDEYEQVARATLDFMLRELATPKQAMIASLSAVDDKNEEGGFYLWSIEEIRQILNKEEQKLIIPLWGLDSSPDLEGRHHLVVTENIEALAKRLGINPGKADQLLASAREKLMAARSKRGLPRDAKQLAAWNALALSAFSQAAGLPGGEPYRVMAKRIRDYLTGTLWKRGELYRAVGRQGPLGKAGLEDYAYVARAMYDWWQLSRDSKDLKFAITALQQAWQRFYGDQGWQLEQDPLLRYGSGQTVVLDGPLPSPSASLIDTSLRLAEQTGQTQLREHALRALNVGRKDILALPVWHATRIAALGRVQKPSIYVP